MSMSKQKVYVVLEFSDDTYYPDFGRVVGVYKDVDYARVAASELEPETDKDFFEVQEAYLYE